jgi:hypothetical protein
MDLPGPDMGIYTAAVDSIFTGVIPGVKPPSAFSLEQNYPNPVSGITNFAYRIHSPSTVTLKIYDVFGKEVTVIADRRFRNPGKYIEQFDVTSAGLAPGLYYFSLVSSEQTVQKKMIVE